MVSSSHHHRNDVVQYCKAFDNPHFFKVVLADALKDQKLEIPTKFVREHGQIAFLNNQICLKVADGREWTVDLKKRNGRVWLHDHGWKKFVEFYSIGFEYFLVFKYEKESSSFHVVIFDLTATEIEYSTKKNRLDKAKEEVGIKIDLDHDDLDLVFYPQDFKAGKVSFNTAIEPINGGRKLPSTTSQQARAMEKASTFQSTTLNPSFTCKIWPSNIQRIYLTVPRSFAEMHMEKDTKILLQVSDERIWETRCHISGTSRLQRMARFRNGWKNFARDNNLQVGDACVFEMITKNSRRISFKVRIFRAS